MKTPSHSDSIKLLFLLSIFTVSANLGAEDRINPSLFFTAQDAARGRANMETATGKAYFSYLESLNRPHIQRYLQSKWYDKPSSVIRNSVDWIPGKAPYTYGMPIKAAYFLLTEDKNAAHMLRADLLRASGGFEKHGMWRPQGIHEALSTIGLVMAYDCLKDTDYLSKMDAQYIEEMFHSAGKRLYGLMQEDLQGEMRLFNFLHAELCAIGSIALLFPHFEESEEWLRTAMKTHERSILRDYFPDGGYGEGASNYVNVSLFPLFLFTEALRNQKGFDYWTLPSVADTFKGAGDWLIELTNPAGDSWALGDSPRGPRHMIGLFEYLAARTKDGKFRWAAETAFKRKDINTHFGSVEMALLYGDLTIIPKQPDHHHKLFPFSGYSFHKQGWGKGAGHLSVRYGPSGRGGPGYPAGYTWPSHSHPDILHLEFSWGGSDWLKDYGSSSYAQPDHFMWYRSTAAHNTVGLGGQTQFWLNENMEDNFRKLSDPKLSPGIMEESVQRYVYPDNRRLHFSGKAGEWSYFSAEAMTFPQAWHTRSFIWDRTTGLLLVSDDMSAQSEERFEWYWNVEGDCDVIGPKTVRVDKGGGKTLLIQRISSNEEPWRKITRKERANMPAGATLLTWGKTGESIHENHVLLPGTSDSWVQLTDQTLQHKDGTQYFFPDNESGKNAFRIAMVSESPQKTIQAWAMIHGTCLEHEGSPLAESDQKETSFFFDLKNKRGVIITPWINDTSKYNVSPMKEAQISIYLPIKAKEIRVDQKRIRSSGNNRFDFSVGYGTTSVEWQ